MNKTGKNIQIEIGGESHSKEMYIIIKGIKKDEEISFEEIKRALFFRNPKLFFNTQRQEEDLFIIESGFTGSKTNGDPIKIVVQNKSINNKDYNDGFLRPSHADYTRYVANGNITSGGGMSSGRMTILLTILGSICSQILERRGILIVSHLMSLYNINDESFNEENIEKYIENKQYNSEFPCISQEFYKKSMELLNTIKQEKDGVGCVVETAIIGIDPGVGDPFFDSVESKISNLIFSIPAIKGIEFGDGFELTKKKSSEVEDAFVKKDDKIITATNHNGGINGGITNGMPIIFKCAIKPVPTIKQPLTSFNIKTNKEETKVFTGEYDVFFGNRAIPSINGVTAFAVLDLLYD